MQLLDLPAQQESTNTCQSQLENVLAALQIGEANLQ